MSKNYKCSICDFTTIYYNDIKRHINRINKCSKNHNNDNKIIYSDDQLFVLSLIPYDNNVHNVTKEEITHLKNSRILIGNKDELFNNIDDIVKNKLKTCKYCNLKFNKINDLKKHIVVNCFFENLKKNNNEQNPNKNLIINSNNTEQSNNENSFNTNNYNQCNVSNNIININLEIKSPVPFDQNWDISKINDKTKRGIIVSNIMYTSLLEEILKNEINLNIIMDNESDSGMVYKNDIVKYVEMKSKDIVEKTMEKLNNQLLDINNDDKVLLNDIMDYCRKMINKKYIDYQKDEAIQKNVEKLLINMYETKKHEAKEMAEKVLNNKNLNDGY